MTKSLRVESHDGQRDPVMEDSRSGSPPLLLCLPAPIGWIAITVSEVRAAKRRVLDLGLDAMDVGSPATNGSQAVRTLDTPEQAAEALGVDASWLLRGARERTVPHVRFGKYVRFDREELIKHGAVPARPPA